MEKQPCHINADVEDPAGKPDFSGVLSSLTLNLRGCCMIQAGDVVRVSGG
jgi:hypothetical protein